MNECLIQALLVGLGCCLDSVQVMQVMSCAILPIFTADLTLCNLAKDLMLHLSGQHFATYAMQSSLGKDPLMLSMAANQH